MEVGVVSLAEGVVSVVVLVAALVGETVLFCCLLDGFRPYVEPDFFVLVSLAMYWNNWSAVFGGRRNHMR